MNRLKVIQQKIRTYELLLSVARSQLLPFPTKEFSKLKKVIRADDLEYFNLALRLFRKMTGPPSKYTDEELGIRLPKRVVSKDVLEANNDIDISHIQSWWTATRPHLELHLYVEALRRYLDN